MRAPPGSAYLTMPQDELDNPIHTALASIHAALALRAGDACRYPADHAPFLGVPAAGIDVDEALASLVPAGESVYLLGIAPQVPRGWRLEAHAPLAQMVCLQPLAVAPGPEPVALDARHRDDVLALTALVYPHYFRARTMELGCYQGFYEGGRLAAIIGERLGSDSGRELSAICTHPDFLGRGYARRLTALMANRILASGRRPFLHVSYANTRALSLYEQLGFVLRRDIPFHSLRRP